MANAMFTSFLNGILGSHATYVDLDANTVSLMFVDHADDTPVAATDDFLDDILSAARVPALASCPTVGTKTIGTISAGTFGSAAVTFTALTGDQSESFVMFKNTGTDTTCNLIGFWDTATGLPLLPNGGDVVITPNASGWFTI